MVNTNSGTVILNAKISILLYEIGSPRVVLRFLTQANKWPFLSLCTIRIAKQIA